MVITATSNPTKIGLSQILYCGGVKGALSMSIMWTLIFMFRELYSSFVGIDSIFSHTEVLIFWASGFLTIALSILGIQNRVDRIKYAGLHFGCFMQAWIALQLYLSGDHINSFAPAVTALWLFGAAMFFKGVMNASGTCVSKER